MATLSTGFELRKSLTITVCANTGMDMYKNRNTQKNKRMIPNWLIKNTLRLSGTCPTPLAFTTKIVLNYCFMNLIVSLKVSEEILQKYIPELRVSRLSPMF